jgi:hypothetical protein
MKFIQDLFAKITGGTKHKLRVRYYLAKELTEGLRGAEHVYDNDPGRLPISKDDYLVLLNAFEKLIARVETIPAAYDTDFRRNLPGGGLDGLQAPDMSGRIASARQYVKEYQATAAAGKSIIQNIDACLHIMPHDANIDTILKSLKAVVMRVASGVVRPADIHPLPR